MDLTHLKFENRSKTTRPRFDLYHTWSGPNWYAKICNKYLLTHRRLFQSLLFSWSLWSSWVSLGEFLKNDQNWPTGEARKQNKKKSKHVRWSQKIQLRNTRNILEIHFPSREKCPNVSNHHLQMLTFDIDHELGFLKAHNQKVASGHNRRGGWVSKIYHLRSTDEVQPQILVSLWLCRI